VSDAAAVMGRGKKQVENLLYRARKALKEALETEEML
jgi:DNA-directed RNA polymerase specialized sigma24 family protein